MKIENFTRLLQEAPRDARITTGTNKYGNAEAKAGLTSGGRLVAWVRNRKEYVAQNQTARSELAKTLTETYGAGFDVKRLKMAPGRALTVRDVAVWIKRAETYTAKVGKENQSMAKATVRDFDATVKQIAHEKRYTTPIPSKYLEATRVLVEQTIAKRPPDLPPITGESAKKLEAELVTALIDGLRKQEQNVDGSLRFTDRPLLERVIGFTEKTSLTGVDFSRVLKEVASAPRGPERQDPAGRVQSGHGVVRSRGRFPAHHRSRRRRQPLWQHQGADAVHRSRHGGSLGSQ
jgi:hypothetical protein